MLGLAATDGQWHEWMRRAVAKDFIPAELKRRSPDVCTKCERKLTKPPKDHQQHGWAPASQVSLHHNAHFDARMIEDMYFWWFPDRRQQPFETWRDEYVDFHGRVATIENWCIACHFPWRYTGEELGTNPQHPRLACGFHVFDGLQGFRKAPKPRAGEDWQDFEDVLLEAAVAWWKLNRKKSVDWKTVAKMVRNRGHQACRCRWATLSVRLAQAGSDSE
jgi:hypothetical protein